MPTIEVIDHQQGGGLLSGQKERRRSERLLARVPIEVVGQDALGSVFIEAAAALCFNQHGARISLKHSLIPEEVILIKNLQNDIEEEFRVVEKLEGATSGLGEWSLAALEPEGKIWQVTMTLPAPGEEARAVIECPICLQPTLSVLSSIEYDFLLTVGTLSRYCRKCGEVRAWRMSNHYPSSQSAPSSKGQELPVERRSRTRQCVSLGVRVRNLRGASHNVEIRNISKGGLCFTGARPFQVGDGVCVTFPFSLRRSAVERIGTIIWTTGNDSERFYGVRFVQRRRTHVHSDLQWQGVPVPA